MIENFKQVYQQLNKTNLFLMDELYSVDAIFIDPFHKIENLNKIKEYFADIYQNLVAIEFSFHDFSSNQNNHYICWDMALTHPKLNSGKKFTVPGITHLKTNEDDKIIYHHDYFDAGCMLYEKISLIGPLIRWVKKQL